MQVNVLGFSLEFSSFFDACDSCEGELGPVGQVEEAFYDGGATFHEIFQNSPQAHKQWYSQP